MAYQAQEWTVNALSVEFKINRRTAAKRLEHVKACRVEGIAKYYLMVDAAPAPLMSQTRTTPDGEVIDFNAERARLTKEQADKTELENKQLRAELVSRSRIEAGLAVIDLALKARLLTMPLEHQLQAAQVPPDLGREPLRQGAAVAGHQGAIVNFVCGRA